MNKHSSVLNKIVSAIGLILCVVFGLMLIFNLLIIAKGLIQPDVPPSVFGLTPMVVKSGSMSSDVQHKLMRTEIIDMTDEQLDAIKVGDVVYSMVGDYKLENHIVSVNNMDDDESSFYLVERPAADHIEVGDLIFSKKTDTADIKVGDVISFMENKSVVTHRVIGIKNEDGSRAFLTKGDANNGEDVDPVAESSVVGVFKTRVPMLGDFIYFLQKPVGMAIFIGVPVLAFIIFDIIRRSRSGKKDDDKKEELEKELERLRALAKEQEERLKAEAANKPSSASSNETGSGAGES